MLKKAYIDFETANRSYIPCEIGVVGDGINIDTMLDVPESEWVPFNIEFMFGSNRKDFRNYLDADHPCFLDVMAEHPELEDYELYAWNAPTERNCLAKAGIEHPVTCLMQLAKKQYGKQPAGFYKLENFAKMLGVEVDTSKTHAAAYDAYITRLVHERMEADNG